MQLIRVLGLLVILALTAMACGDDTDPGEDAADDTTPDDSAPDDTDPGGAEGTPTPVALVTAERAAPSAEPGLAAAAITAFGVDLHGALDAGTDPGENLVSSPASVAIALGMLEPGTVGDARTQLHDLLHVDDIDAFHESVNALEQSLEQRVPRDYGDGDPGEVEVGIANAAYLQQGYPFEPAYLDTVGTHYGPVLSEVDFRPDPDAVAHEINDFVAEATRDRITDLIDEGVISPDTVLALVNALYLKASWLAPFDATQTADAPFTLLDGTEVDIPLMHGSGDSSAAGDGWVGATKVLSGDLSLQVILPDDGRFDEIETDLGAVLDEYTTRRTSGSSLAVPRFESRFAAGLDDALQALGLTDVYLPGNLLGIADDSTLALDKALHETFVAVDEEGIEAAAATVLLAYATSAPAEPPVPVVLDRPFLFRITDDQTGATLFVGRIVDPR